MVHTISAHPSCLGSCYSVVDGIAASSNLSCSMLHYDGRVVRSFLSACISPVWIEQPVSAQVAGVVSLIHISSAHPSCLGACYCLGSST